jgi:hypothetical protein
MEYSIFDFLRLKTSFLTKPKKKPESNFISNPIKVKKIVAYSDKLDYNAQAKHLFTLIKNQ